MRLMYNELAKRNLLPPDCLSPQGRTLFMTRSDVGDLIAYVVDVYPQRDWSKPPARPALPLDHQRLQFAVTILSQLLITDTDVSAEAQQQRKRLGAVIEHVSPNYDLV